MDAGGTRHGGRLGARSEHSPTGPATALSLGMKKSAALSKAQIHRNLAATFTLANRWFCSAPCQTFPNRRFLMAGTAYGDIATDIQSLTDPPPPNGTIFDRLHAHGIGWRDYFTDLPYTAIIPSIVEGYPGNLATLDDFLDDCAKGTLPSVSFVDPEVGAVSLVGKSARLAPGGRPDRRHAGHGRR